MIDATAALEAVELGHMVRSVAQSVAQAQLGLDLNSLRTTMALARSQVELDGEPVNLLELGLLPSFYQLAETVIAVKLSISMSEEQSQETKKSESSSKTESKTDVSVSLGWFSASVSKTTTTTTTTTSVDARFASRFQYSAEASSALTTRLVPVPPPAALMDLARQLAAD
ncbi:MAG: hypothetical protein KDK70_23255 [Myxococcales bacterium]|nr:hypothetical protein [Myxococcales bacterium]